jgi:cytochrome c
MRGDPTRAGLVLAGLALLVSACTSSAAPAAKRGAGDPSPAAAEGKTLFVSRGCIACHRAPGVPEAQGTIGPNLRGVGDPNAHPKIADAVQNTHDNLVRWLVNPPAVKPGTAMPSLGLSQDEAGKIAAFLETLK